MDANKTYACIHKTQMYLSYIEWNNIVSIVMQIQTKISPDGGLVSITDWDTKT